MANEITVTLSLTVNKPAVMTSALSRAVTAALFTMTGNPWVGATQLIGTSATAIGLGGITAPHWAYFHNLDATNYLTIRNGAAGADLLKLLAGEYALCPLLDTAVPYAVANTSSCLLEFLILSL
jgi:hypothetical protein